jgi:hypothetical protein
MKAVLNPKICSKETIKLKQSWLMGEKRNGIKLFLKIFQWQENRTAQVNYGKAGRSGMYYSLWLFSSLNPKYSCIVVVHSPILRLIITVLMWLGPALKELHKKYLPMRLLQTLKNLIEK